MFGSSFTAGRPGVKPKPSPTSTSTTGYGSASLRAARTDAAMAALTPLIQERAAVPKAVRVLPQIPLSGPGKISKLLLRREAARELFQSDIDLAAKEFGVRVAIRIVDDERFDQVATLHLESGGEASAPLKAAIARVFEGHTLRHHWL